METVLVKLLSPYLPRLLGKAGEAGAKVAGAAVDAAWDHARRIWDRLHPAIASRPSAEEAATDVAEAPDDADAQAAFRVQLKKLLADDPGLAADVGSLLEQARSAGVVATGAGGVAAGVIHAETGGIAAGIIQGGVNTPKHP